LPRRVIFLSQRDEDKEREMVEVKCQEAYSEALEFAEKIGLKEQLISKIEYLNSYANSEDDPNNTKCMLYKDWAPYSFGFTMLKKNKAGEYVRWFNGGLIFHGSHDNGGDGSYPTLSVNVSPQNGWSIHT